MGNHTEDTYTGKAEREFDAVTGLFRKRPRLALFLTALLAVGCLIYFLVLRDENKSLQSKAAILEADGKTKDGRILLLETQLAPFRVLAIERFPGHEVGEALAKLGADLNQLQADFEKATSSIQNFSVKLSIDVSADWVKGKEPGVEPLILMTSSGGSSGEISVVLSNSEKKNVVFFQASEDQITRVNDRVYHFEIQYTAPAGDSIMGTSKKLLQKVSDFRFSISGVSKTNVIGSTPAIDMSNGKLTIFVNGTKFGEAIMISDHRKLEISDRDDSTQYVIWRGAAPIKML